MKTFFWILISFCTVLQLQAQDVQVTLVDPCSTIAKKSTIIINDNAVAAVNTQSTISTQSNTFNFSLTTSANTSAGVYNASGNLIRTLWNGVRYDAGSYKAVWSGVMDDGTLAPPGTYQAKVLTNNVQYTWEGVIGNTSADLTSNIHLGFWPYGAFVFTATKGFLGDSFWEGGVGSHYISTSAIQTRQDIDVGGHAIITKVATDGTTVYWAANDQYHNPPTTFIYGSKVSDNSGVNFSAGITTGTDRGSSSPVNAIDYRSTGNNYQILGLAVQPTGSYLFSSRNGIDSINVLNKATGALVVKVPITAPGTLTCDLSNNLWVKNSSGITKFTVNANGTLANSGVNITSIANPGEMAISPTTGELAVLDLNTNQVKFFDGASGAFNLAFGQAGGYTNSPAVTNTKFMFSGSYGGQVNGSNAIAFQPDGSFWVNDIGDYRILHFKADKTYKEQIDFIPSFRSVNADPNNPTRVFADELEFHRDYSRPLDNGVNGSWKLVNNWKPETVLDAYRKFNQVVTLSNGHTYASGDTGNGGGYLYDLTSTGAKLIRSNFDGTNFKIEADGSFYYRVNNSNQSVTIHKQTLQGFNQTTFEPYWGNDVSVVTTPNLTPTSPYSFHNNTRGASTNASRYFFFNPEAHSSLPYILNGAYVGIGYHLGAIKTGSNTWDWQASKSTFSRFESGTDYHGDYPRNGDFDIGNNDFNPSGQHSENCQALVNGSNIFWNVNGEFWKANTSGGGEINIWNHFSEDGLLIGNFGVTGVEASLNNQYGMAGNSFSTALVKVGNDFYIYHCDENRHGGIHSWHVSGLNTIAEQIMPIIVSPAAVTINDESSLMAGLPYKSTTFNGGNGWTVTANSGSAISTDVNTYQKDDPSIYIQGTSTQILQRTLNNTSALNNWVLNGSLSFVGTEPTIGGSNYNYLELVDVAGKVICRYYELADTRNNYNRQLIINNTAFYQGANGSTEFLKTYNNISFSYTNGKIVFTLANFPPVTIGSVIDPGADMSKPAFLRVNQNSPGNQNHAMDIRKFKFSGK